MTTGLGGGESRHRARISPGLGYRCKGLEWGWANKRDEGHCRRELELVLVFPFPEMKPVYSYDEASTL
jgi:hypothetical protein